MRRSAVALALALLLPLPGLAGQVVVKQGETLSDIAARYHVSVDRLLQLNGIKDPKGLQVGTKLTVPGAPSSPSRGGGGGSPTKGAGGGNYTVKSGETISEIADRYGISTNRLLELNGIRDAKGLQVGTRITVPTAGPAKPSKTASARSTSGPSSPASRGPANYTVKSGETISEIADRYGISSERLLELNGIRDPKGLQVGSRITVPTAGPAKPAKPPVLPAISAAQGKALSHTVRPGDTLSDIANTYGVPVEKIASLNGLKDPDNLVPDTQLKLRNPPPLPKPAAKPVSHPPAKAASKPAAKPASKPASTPVATAPVATTKAPAAKPATTATSSTPTPGTTAVTAPQATTKPAETTPKPVVSKPAAEKHEAAKPAATKPVITTPAVTKPVVTKPVVTKPVAEKPVVEKPAVPTAEAAKPAQAPSAKPVHQPATKPEPSPKAETAQKPETVVGQEQAIKPEVKPEPKPQPKPEAKAEVTPKAETTTKPAKTEVATGKTAKPDWRSFGPLQVDWANWQPMGGSFVAPGLNATGQSFYLAVNCSAKRINATGPSGAWKTWDLPTTDYEQQLVKDLCREKAG